ncbi:MAG: T9SS type A sorting domain-containing protein [Candidatus Kapabacteria bacterium]|nr:T9SS type A sorting domain-containing protein [Candidatus Kapabacteria bacterium]
MTVRVLYINILSVILFFLLSLGITNSQIIVHSVIDENQIISYISPFIYGTNGYKYKSKIPALRLGGNRFSSYNWENNASNAGKDWFNQNDNYLPWIMGIPNAEWDIPASVITSFLDTCFRNGSYPLFTVQMAGYAAKDKLGIVPDAKTAPSDRWVKVNNTISGSSNWIPDTTDNNLYIDQMFEFLKVKYGQQFGTTQIGISLDNEPCLWSETHPIIHPSKTTCDELIKKSVDLAKTIKSINRKFFIYGPVLYGFNAFQTFQDAPDWNLYSKKYSWFIDYYLDRMSQSSLSANGNLLDVLDLHWYPDIQGVYNGDTSKAVSIERMQCIRSLWDKSYKENSWIGQYFSPVALIPHLLNSINTYFPSVRLSFSEYDYGANWHISGGIAEADFLANLGKYGVYLATKWNNADKFCGSAFKLFTGDINNPPYGNSAIECSNDDQSNASIYAAVDRKIYGRVHILAINKNYDSSIKLNVDFKTQRNFVKAYAYYFDQSDTIIKSINIDKKNLENNKFIFNLTPLSVYHFVLEEATLDVKKSPNDLIIFSYISHDQSIHIKSDLNLDKIELYNSIGELLFIKGFDINQNNYLIYLPLSDGVYFIRAKSGLSTIFSKIIINQ